MRLGILSDVHGNLLALEVVLADMRQRGVDAMINLGDCVTSPLWPRETFELLQTLALPTVRGNHDRWLTNTPPEKVGPIIDFACNALTPEQRQTLADLPASIALFDDVFAVHGTPASDTEYLLEEKLNERLLPVTIATLGERLGGHRESLILCGHSHHQHSAHATDNQLVVNPGGVGCPRYADSKKAFDVEACSPHARYAIATRRGKRWSVELFVLEYDWDQAAARARANGFDAWADAFLGVMTRK